VSAHPDRPIDGDDTHPADHADTDVRCERTDVGYRYEGDWESSVYWTGGAWQTTVPYWVDRLGVAGRPAGSGVDTRHSGVSCPTEPTDRPAGR